MKKVTLMMLSIDRFEIMKQTWETNLKNAKVNLPKGIELELMVCDNGSTDKRVVEYLKKQKLDYFRENKTNEGVGKALNQMYLRSKGDYLAILGNDLQLPPGWLAEAIKYADGVPNSGLIGFDWGHAGLPPFSTKFGIHGHWLTPTLNRVFGVWVLRRAIVEEIGFFCEDFHEYGLEDSDINERVNIAGYNSVYVPTMKCKHVCHDVGQETDYRKKKDASMIKNMAIFAERAKNFHVKGIKEPLPPARDPL